MSMPSRLAFKVTELSQKAAGYGIPGETVDGNDVLAVRAAVARAVHRAREGAGPTFIEALTYRWRGHSKSDKNLYRSREEIAEWKQHCPIQRFTHLVLGQGVLDPPTVERIEAGVREEIRAAVVFGADGPQPSIDQMLDGVYAPSSVDHHDIKHGRVAR